ncbi:hypothetical protein [Belliella pelovolcani]|uniref:hypothetical protein n=1 Tax=Belliella pelovolcani TaxID=529505 RepID=UPI0039187F3A
MKNQFKTSKLLRLVATGALSLMLVMNVMVSLEFDEDKILPSVTFIELGNKAMAKGDGDLDLAGTYQCKITITSDLEGYPVRYCGTCTYIKNSRGTTSGVCTEEPVIE